MSRRFCWHKRRYPDMDAARAQRARSQRRASRLLRIYQCDGCGGFHLTKQAVKAWPPRLAS